MLCGTVLHSFMYVTSMIEKQVARGSQFFMGFESILDLKIKCYQDGNEAQRKSRMMINIEIFNER